MRRPPHRPGAGILLLLVISALGGFLGLVVEGLVWRQEGTGRGFPEAFQHVSDEFQAPTHRPWTFAWIGAAAAFLVTGAVRGTFRNVGTHLGTFFGLFGGAVGGAALGMGSFLYLWARFRGPASVPELALQAAQTEPVALVLFTLGGTAIGVSVAAFLMSNRTIEGLASSLIGLLLGTAAGTVLYAISSMAVEQPSVANVQDVFAYMGRTVSALRPLELVFAGYGAGVGALLARNRWRFYGIVTFVSLLAVIGGFLVYSLFVTLPRVEGSFRAFAWTLFAAETMSLGMVLLYSFYTIDVASRKEWRRGPVGRPHSMYYVPKVAFQVPCYNEPPELVFETLRSLMAVEYPKDRMLIMVLDDSTNPETAQALRAFSDENGLLYLHRPDRRGYKAGALNDALKAVPADVDLFAIIDADYQIKPGYLRETVGYFADTNLAWVQTPQDYRNPDQSFLTRQYYLADAYFYRTVMPSRNEENTIIFAGTMGIVRRQALVEVGGWGEKYITEDAELSLRLLLTGYTAIYINKTFGKGLIPATFEGYKKQHYRWAFGGGKILRGHLHHLLFGRLTRRQAFDYFVGTVHWFEGLFILLIALLLITLASAEILGFRISTHHSQEILLVGLIPFFVLADGLTRLHTVMRGALHLSVVQTFRILGMWFAVKFSNAAAATKGLVGFNIPFVRTPKEPTRRVGRKEAFERALRVTRFESSMAGLIFLLAVGLCTRAAWEHRSTGAFRLPVLFLLFWMLYYFLVFVSAPVYAYKSYVTFRPERDSSAPLSQRPTPEPAEISREKGGSRAA